MRRSGVVVWLEADPAELATRVTAEGTAAAGRRLSGRRDSPPSSTERHQLYAAVAHHRVATGGRSPEDVCTEVEELWRAAT